MERGSSDASEEHPSRAEHEREAVVRVGDYAAGLGGAAVERAGRDVPTGEAARGRLVGLAALDW